MTLLRRLPWLATARNSRAVSPLFYVMPLAIALAFASLALLIPRTFTNQYVSDMFYLLNAGYLVHGGYVPHVDFAWQFGGYEVYLIALSLQVFGVSVEAIEQAIFLGFAVTALLFLLGTTGQARLATFCLLLLLITATSITLSPLENGHVDMAKQSFSMFYNRICWALVMVLYSTLLLKEHPLRQWQLLVCAAAGVLILTTKLTFALMLIPAVAPLLMRNGAAGLGMCVLYALVLMGLGWLALGFGPQAYINSFGDLANAAGGQFNWDWAVRKLVYLTAYNSFLICASLAAIWYTWRASLEKTVKLKSKLFVLIALVLLSVVVTVTTGTLDYFTSATTPIFVFVAILCADEVYRGPRATGRVFGAAVALFAAAFSMPYLMNYLAGVRSEARLPANVFTQGPLRGLVIDQLEGARSPEFQSEAAALTYIASRNDLEGGTKWLSDFEWQYVHTDAIRLAQTLPDIQVRHVLTFYPSTLPFALRAAPIRTFPLLANDDSPSIRGMRLLPAEVDTVLVLRSDKANPLHARFGHSLRRDFEPKGRSTLWDLYVRRSDTDQLRDPRMRQGS